MSKLPSKQQGYKVSDYRTRKECEIAGHKHVPWRVWKLLLKALASHADDNWSDDTPVKIAVNQTDGPEGSLITQIKVVRLDLENT